MDIAARGLSPGKRESRPAGSAQRLPNVCHCGGDRHEDSTEVLRLQRLRPLGITGPSADLLARLIWNPDGGKERMGGVV
jgi:hypothetical protein